MHSRLWTLVFVDAVKFVQDVYAVIVRGLAQVECEAVRHHVPVKQCGTRSSDESEIMEDGRVVAHK